MQVQIDFCLYARKYIYCKLNDDNFIIERETESEREDKKCAYKLISLMAERKLTESSRQKLIEFIWNVNLYGVLVWRLATHVLSGLIWLRAPSTCTNAID